LDGDKFTVHAVPLDDNMKDSTDKCPLPERDLNPNLDGVRHARLLGSTLNVTKQYRGLTVVYTANGVSGEPLVSLQIHVLQQLLLHLCISFIHRILRGAQQRCQQLRLRSVK
jgi:hypothetical protein